MDYSDTNINDMVKISGIFQTEIRDLYNRIIGSRNCSLLYAGYFHTSIKEKESKAWITKKS